MGDDTIILFLEGSASRAALLFQRMKPDDQKRTFWVQTVPEAIEVLQRYRDRLDIVSLCYDLNGVRYSHPAREDCGLEVVRWLESVDPGQYSHVRFIVHTWNPHAGRKMDRRLRAKGYRVIRVPFGS